ncbi:unnamed protein product, partial [Phaeothamnion confervicola]
AVVHESGVFLGRVAAALVDFDAPGLHRKHAWDLANAAEVEQFVEEIDSDDRRALVRSVLAAFSSAVLPQSGLFRKAVIMGDYNDCNIILTPDGTGVAGVIDFGDAVHTWLVNEVAIAMAYIMLSPFARETGNPLGAAALMLRGFQSVFPLAPAETKYLRTLVACRLAVSVTLGAYSSRRDPGNAYLLLHQAPAWEALELL